MRVQKEQQYIMLTKSMLWLIRNLDLYCLGNRKSPLEKWCVLQKCERRWGVSFVNDEIRRWQTSLLSHSRNHSLESNYSHYLAYLLSITFGRRQCKSHGFPHQAKCYAAGMPLFKYHWAVTGGLLQLGVSSWLLIHCHSACSHVI